jgi:hypothetical protein
MTSWDTTCGSKYDRIHTEKLTFASKSGELQAGDLITMDTSGSNNLHGPFMGGSWSVRIYETGYSHPVSDFTGDLAKVMSFPDAKTTTFKIDAVQFKLPKIASNGTNVFQVSFTAQDFSHATYFCVNVFYNLDTGAITNTNPMVTSDVSVLNGGVAIRGDPCLSGSDCASDLYCDEKSTVCKTKDKSADESVFKKCSCNVSRS